MRIVHTQKYIVITFNHPQRMLSSASYGGGFITADSIVNIRTTAEETIESKPEQIIGAFLEREGLHSSAVGLLTSAPIKHAQFILVQERGIKVLAVVTAGVSNALNITERSRTQYTGEPIRGEGTINTVIVTSGRLLDDCMVSTIITATEAKTAALFDLGIGSRQSASIATGTGTDTVVVVSGSGKTIQYAGGHTVYGQLVGAAVYTAVKGSLEKRKPQKGDLERISREFEF